MYSYDLHDQMSRLKSERYLSDSRSLPFQ